MEVEAVREILDAARAGARIERLGDEHAIAILPEGYTARDISQHLPPPERPRAKVQILSLQSFIDYVKAFGGDHSAIFADEQQGSYSAILDYHTAAGDRGTCDHRVDYTCPESIEWKTWLAASGRLMTQVEFAQHIEANLPDIVAPSPADMLQVALTLQVKKNVDFSSEMRLTDGQHQFRYDETIQGSTRAGDISIPEAFEIEIPVLFGSPRVRIPARLRYRLTDSRLAIGYELIRPQHVRLEAVSRVTEELQRALPAVSLFAAKKPEV